MGTGDSLVSFVFGLEVTWDLLQVQLEEEAEGENNKIFFRAHPDVMYGGLRACCWHALLFAPTLAANEE